MRAMTAAILLMAGCLGAPQSATITTDLLIIDHHIAFTGVDHITTRGEHCGDYSGHGGVHEWTVWSRDQPLHTDALVVERFFPNGTVWSDTEPIATAGHSMQLASGVRGGPILGNITMGPEPAFDGLPITDGMEWTTTFTTTAGDDEATINETLVFHWLPASTVEAHRAQGLCE